MITKRGFSRYGQELSLILTATFQNELNVIENEHFENSKTVYKVDVASR